ncbi:MAG: Fe-S-containing hydro-lyase [Candidatus Marinimicrobia bacterium]|nr:Fe-S-containing hydro-lyase [Candidatus Neomarinimicrobiota bacterium]
MKKLRIHELTVPLTAGSIAPLKAGDKVLLSGIIYSARDAAHKRLAEMIHRGDSLPFDLAGQVIYYLSPSPAKPGMIIGSSGPTSSYRLDSYTPALLELGLKGMIGKGARSREVIDAIVKNRAVYFMAVGGAAVKMAQSIVSARMIAFPDLETEAILELKIEKMPLFVAVDADGSDIFKI